MSIEALTWALTVPVGGNAKVVLLGLANHAHPDGSHAYPSLDRLAIYAHCDRSTARRNVRKLVADGWILEDGKGPNGENRYRLALGVAERHPSQNATVASEPKGGGTSASKGVAPVPPEPSVEPTANRKSEASAPAREALPDGFPEDLKPHARAVYSVLKRVAEQHNARAVKPLALANVMMARPYKPFVKAAYDFAAWAADPPRPIKDVVASYRTWIDRERDLASYERMPTPGSVAHTPTPRPRDAKAAEREALRREADEARQRLADKESSDDE